MGKAKPKPELKFEDKANTGGSTGLLASGDNDDRNELQRDVDVLLKIEIPETYSDPSKKWADDLLRVEINFEEAGVASISFIERITDFMYRSIRTICTTGEAEKFTREEWQQLVTSMTLTALSEDETVAPLLTENIRDWLKEIVREYVSEDRFILETMEMIASIHLQQPLVVEVADQEGDAPKPDAVFLITEGRVVKDETAPPVGQEIVGVLKSENAVKILSDFVEERKKDVLDKQREEKRLAQELKQRAFHTRTYLNKHPQDVGDMMGNLLTSATRRMLS